MGKAPVSPNTEGFYLHFHAPLSVGLTLHAAPIPLVAPVIASTLPKHDPAHADKSASTHPVAQLSILVEETKHHAETAELQGHKRVLEARMDRFGQLGEIFSHLGSSRSVMAPPLTQPLNSDHGHSRIETSSSLNQGPRLLSSLEEVPPVPTTVTSEGAEADHSTSGMLQQNVRGPQREGDLTEHEAVSCAVQSSCFTCLELTSASSSGEAAH